MKNIVILISGRGSNMQALVQACRQRSDCQVAAVVANRPASEGLLWAKNQGLAVELVSHKDFPDRAAFDAALLERIEPYQPDFILLAGFMRVLTDVFVSRCMGRLVNIHPSLLPAFPGLNTHARVLEQGVKLHGCTVHFVTPALDAGPAICQSLVPVLPGDSVQCLQERVLATEHRIYVQALDYLLKGYCTLEADGVHWSRQVPQLFAHPLLNHSEICLPLS